MQQLLQWFEKSKVKNENDFLMSMSNYKRSPSGALSEGVISTWGINRALIYWIPALLIIFALRSYLFLGVTLKDVLIVLLYAIAFVVMCEYWLFGFRIVLTDDTLRYRSKGFPWPKEILIKKENIDKVESIYFSRYANVKAARLMIYLKDSDQPINLVLASFKPSDIKKFVTWLPVKPA